MTSFAWAAGFFDGEGCIDFTDRRTLTIRLSQRDRRPLKAFEELFGGKTYPSSEGCHQWTLKGKPALGAIKAMCPYFILKDKQVDVALEWGSQPWRQLGVPIGKRKQKTDEQHGVDTMLGTLCKSLKRAYE